MKIKELIVDELQKVLNKLIAYNPQEHKLKVEQYLSKIDKDFGDKSDDAFRYAIKQFWEKELWNKNINYFLAIISRYEDELQHQKALERRALGGIPKNNVT